MKRSYRFISLALTGIMLLTLAAPAAGFADSPFKRGNSNDDKFSKQGPPAFVYERMLKNFSFMDGKKIKVNRRGINFDVPPVIKEGRTLIPVRAITEALGATVEWNPTKSTVTITSPDEEIVIVFYMSDADKGKITVTKDGKTEDITTDVRPGLINNRTFVPLRLIAEILGLKVDYNNQTGETDIKDGPRLNPARITFEDQDDVKAVDVKLTLNDYEFKGIKGLDDDDDYSYDEDDAVVTIDDDYIESLDDENTTLTFQFEDSDDKAVTRSFKILLEYNDEENELPVISPQKVTFEDDEDIEDVTIDFTLNGYTFEGIQGLEEDEDFDVDGTEVTIDNNYIEDLDNEVTTLYLLFEDDDKTVKKAFEIRLPFNTEFEKPTLSPTKVEFDELDDVEDVVVTIDFNDYDAKNIMNGSAVLDEGDDYTVDGNKVILDDDYLKTLDDESTDLTFVFEDEDGEEYELNFEVVIDEL